MKDEKGKAAISKQILKRGYEELILVQKQIFADVATRRFLLSFFFYSMGLQTLMLVAIMFGQNEVGIEGPKLIITILILQLVAIVGATFFAFISKKVGNKASLMSRNNFV